MASSSSQPQLQSLSVVLRPGPFNAVVEKIADGINEGMCVVSETHAASPLQVGDIIMALNGIELKEVNGGVDEWCKLFEAFSKGERNLVLQRATRRPGATSRGLQGFREIASAKKRLDTAESFYKYTSEEVKCLKDRLKLAKPQLTTAQKEVEEAKSSLEGVYKEHEVIDVDAGGNTSESENNGAVVQRTTRQPGATSRGFQGCREIASAKKRLDTAESLYKYTSEEVKWLKDRLKLVKPQLKAAQKEVEEAKSSLEGMYNEYEVIDVDAGGNRSESDNNGAMKRRVSMSPDGGSEKKARSDALVDNVTDVEQIVVVGAGISDVDGTYKRCYSRTGDSFPRCSCDRRYPVYAKDGLWEGVRVKFFIHRPDRCSLWRIMCENDYRRGYFYWHGRADLPPKNDWMTYENGSNPAPQLFIRRPN